MMRLPFIAAAVMAVAVAGCGNRGDDDSGGSAPPPARPWPSSASSTTRDAAAALLAGDDQPVVASLGPLEADLVSTGHARQLGTSRWFEVRVAGATGWADATSLAYLGGTDDVTERTVAKLGGAPTADSMLELGRIVATAGLSNQSHARGDRHRRTDDGGRHRRGDLRRGRLPRRLRAGERMRTSGRRARVHAEEGRDDHPVPPRGLGRNSAAVRVSCCGRKVHAATHAMPPCGGDPPSISRMERTS